MNSSLSLSRILYYNTFIAAIISLIVCAMFLLLIILSAVDVLPNTFNTTFEVPVRLLNLDEFYPLETNNPQFELTHIEVKNSSLEVLPVDSNVSQSLAYLIALVYVGFIASILYFLSRILLNFSNGVPFSSQNAKYVRNIGFFAIGIALYELFIHWSVSYLFADKFDLANIEILNGANIWEINWLSIFLGFVLLSLSTVFKTRTELKELEELTI
jgi:hypothetical protein